MTGLDNIACKGCGETIVEDSAVMLNGWADQQGGKYCSQECAEAAEVEQSLNPTASLFHPLTGQDYEVEVVRHLGFYEYDLATDEYDLVTGRPFSADKRPRQVGKRELYLIRVDGQARRWAIPPAVRREMRAASAGLTEISGRTFIVRRDGSGMQTRYLVKEKRP